MGTGTGPATGATSSGVAAERSASVSATTGASVRGGVPVACSKKRSSSTGKGMTRVLFFSAATSDTVCSSRSCMAPGVSAMVPAASDSLVEAWNSPSAAMTRARRSRSASAWADIERRIVSGSAMSLTSTRSIAMPQFSVGASMTSRSSVLIWSRSDSSVSSSARPITDRSDVWATVDVACT